MKNGSVEYLRVQIDPPKVIIYKPTNLQVTDVDGNIEVTWDEAEEMAQALRAQGLMQLWAQKPEPEPEPDDSWMDAAGRDV